MDRKIVQNFYLAACLLAVVAGFLLMRFAEQEKLDTGETLGEMPMQAGLGAMLIVLSLAGIVIYTLLKVLLFIFTKMRLQYMQSKK